MVPAINKYAMSSEFANAHTFKRSVRLHMNAISFIALAAGNIEVS